MCDEIIKTSTDFVVTETTLDPKLPATEVVTILRDRKTTGQLVFHLSQGGIQKVALVEKTKTEESESDRIRRILGWTKK